MAAGPPHARHPMEPSPRLTEIDAAIARWRAEMAGDPETLDELEAHLRDACAEELARLPSRPIETCMQHAFLRLGGRQELRCEFSKVGARRPAKSTTNLITMRLTLLHSPRLKRYSRRIVVALAIAFCLRAFALAPYRAAGASVAPEIPAGARVLVWRIAPKFAPGDIAVFRDGDLNLLGRIVRADEREVMVTRAEGLERSVPRSAVVGRVFLTTR